MTTINRLLEFIGNEVRFCSMDFGCVTPLYVYRMWGGCNVIGEFAQAMVDLKRMM